MASTQRHGTISSTSSGSEPIPAATEPAMVDSNSSGSSIQVHPVTSTPPPSIAGPPPEPPKHMHMRPPPPPTSMAGYSPVAPIQQPPTTTMAMTSAAAAAPPPPPLTAPIPHHPGAPPPPPPPQQRYSVYEQGPYPPHPAAGYAVPGGVVRPDGYFYPPQQPPPQPMMRPPMDNPWRHSFHAGIAADNAAYMPDSSLLAASQAGVRRKQSPYPPPTLENLSKFRDEAHASNDPQQLLALAKYMLHTIPHLKIQDRQRAAKVREALTTEAYKTVKKLAKFYPEAMYFLAHSYSTGTTGLVQEKDPGKAFSLYVQGAKQNHAACNYRVAVCYELGAGTKKDKAHALQFYRKAANLGDTSAMYKLGMILLKGLLGQSKNPREGISWLKRATQSGDEEHPQAMYELGLAYEKEGIPSVIPDIEYSRELFTQSALCGYAPSQFKLGLAYENGFLNCPIDPRRSIAWYSKAAEQGHLEAELALSGWYLTGAEGILQQNDQEAYLWALKAAERGYAKAEYAVGYYTETGIGIRQNLEEARKWYMRAAAQNNQRAIHRLAQLKKSGPQKRRKHTRPKNAAPDSKDGDCIVM
ncbi:hcp-like protein [Lichtheimia corymbifera JMRC:FSU:9682]|uniref:Hcp-like protein n=1 Tax=Lichtheimia corymbifera JMRC:FSU:9682 TaxID=1263082 RepID=A0A068S5K4_9FUNG|nr:hcp-like protein [Lichtheimia corymbifera JMRC:FSU:9682]